MRGAHWPWADGPVGQSATASKRFGLCPSSVVRLTASEGPSLKRLGYVFKVLVAAGFQLELFIYDYTVATQHSYNITYALIRGRVP